MWVTDPSNGMTQFNFCRHFQRYCEETTYFCLWAYESELLIIMTIWKKLLSLENPGAYSHCLTKAPLLINKSPDSHFWGFQGIAVKCKIYSLFITTVLKDICKSPKRQKRFLKMSSGSLCQHLSETVKKGFPEQIPRSQVRQCSLLSCR